MQPKDVSQELNTSRRIAVDPQKAGFSDDEFDRTFKPTGAITFFLLLVALGLIIWFGIYFLMLERI